MVQQFGDSVASLSISPPKNKTKPKPPPQKTKPLAKDEFSPPLLMLQPWVNSLWSKVIEWQLAGTCKRSKGIPVPCLWVSPKHRSPSTDTVHYTFRIRIVCQRFGENPGGLGIHCIKRDGFSQGLWSYNAKSSLSICSKWCLGDRMLQGNKAEPRSWSGA